MEIILAVATILGGIAAVWFFRDKISAWWSKRRGRAVVPELPLAANPSRDRILDVILRSDAQADWHQSTHGSRSITSYVRDANLRFEINYMREGMQAENFQEPWANRHPDPQATGYWCRLYYGASLIGQWVLVAVDGARAMLPLPTRGVDLRHPGPVPILDYRIAEIHDSLGTLKQYMVRSGLVVEQAPPDRECR